MIKVLNDAIFLFLNSCWVISGGRQMTAGEKEIGNFLFFLAEGTICLSVHSFLSESCRISELFYIILQSIAAFL